MKRLLLIFVLLGSCFAVKAQVFTSVSPSGHSLYYEIIPYTTTAQVINECHYNNQNMGFWLAEDSTLIGHVIIPDTVAYNGVNYPVKKVYHGAFYNHIGITGITLPATIAEIDMESFSKCRHLASIAIPGNVTSIGSYAFGDCINLTTLNIPSSVTTIGDQAFGDCINLTTLNIPSSVTTIGDQAFRGCYNLSSISVQNGNTIYDSRNNCNAIIETSSNKLILGCKNTIIPSTVTEIGSFGSVAKVRG